MSVVNENPVATAEVVRYSRLCYDRKLAGAAGGNISMRIPGRDVFIVTASGVSLRDVSLENLVVVDGGGKILEGAEGLSPSKEISFHLSIYKAKPQINAVVHVHPVFTTVYASLKKKIPLVTVSSRLKVKQGIIVPEQKPGSVELCEEIIQAIKESSLETSVLLMENHGLVAYNTDMKQTFDDAELAEDTAQIAYYGSLLK